MSLGTQRAEAESGDQIVTAQTQLGFCVFLNTYHTTSMAYDRQADDKLNFETSENVNLTRITSGIVMGVDFELMWAYDLF